MSDEKLQMPVFGLHTSLKSYSFLMPTLMLGLYLYFQVHLDQLRQLRQKFIVGTETSDALLKEEIGKEKFHLYPWYVNYVFYEAGTKMHPMSGVLASFQIWWFCPISLLVMQVLLIRTRQDALQMFFILVLSVFSILSFYFWNRYSIKMSILGRLPAYKNEGLAHKAISLARCVIQDLVQYRQRYALLICFPVLSWFVFHFAYQPYRDNAQVFTDSTLFPHVYANQIINSCPQNLGILNTNLRGRSFRGFSFSDSVIQCMDLRSADLSHANLTGVDFSGSRFEEANLHGAILDYALLHDARGLTLDQLASCKSANFAVLPPYLLP